MTTQTVTKPDFTSMTRKDLLALYNDYNVQLGRPKRNSLFSDMKTSLLNVNSAWDALQGLQAASIADKPTRPATVVPAKNEGTTVAATAKKTKEPKAAKAPKAVKAPKAAKVEAGPKKHRREGWTIKVLAKTNPRREGSISHTMFEHMRANKLVTDYLTAAGGPENDAGQWLWNAVRDGHVEVNEPK